MGLDKCSPRNRGNRALPMTPWFLGWRFLKRPQAVETWTEQSGLGGGRDRCKVAGLGGVGSDSGSFYLGSGSSGPSGCSKLRARCILCEPDRGWVGSGRVEGLPMPTRPVPAPHLARVQPVLQPVAPSDAWQR